MLLKILGIFDVVVSIILLLLVFDVFISRSILTIFIIILAVKAIPVFSLDIASFFDVYAILMFVLSIWFNVPAILLVIGFLLSFQKGVVSLL